MKPAFGFIEIARQKRHTASMRKKFLVFSVILFLFTFLFGSEAFFLSMWNLRQRSEAREATRTADVERLRFEALINAEAAPVLRLAESSVIRRYFLSPGDAEREHDALLEFEAARSGFSSGAVFRINDADKKLYLNDAYIYTVDPSRRENYWYHETLVNTGICFFTIDGRPEMGEMMLWIGAPVFYSGNRPAGIVGTGIKINDFFGDVYRNFSGDDTLYFFNTVGQITGARDTRLISGKVTLGAELGRTGEDILARALGLSGESILQFSVPRREVALGTIPALNWYIAVIHPFSFTGILTTSQTPLFLGMMLIIALILVSANVYINKLLQPLNQMVDSLHRIAIEWDIVKEIDKKKSDEIGIIGEFINMTVTDPLTGIYNRRFMEGTLRRFIKSGSRTNSTLSILMIDIDFFKKYNDTYGHTAGDACLKIVAEKIAQGVSRDDDFVARYGGEEFAVILPHTGTAGASVIAGRIINAVRAAAIPHETSAAAGFVTVSVGGATAILTHSHTVEDYINKADAALYRSKQSGRNCYCFEGF